MLQLRWPPTPYSSASDNTIETIKLRMDSAIDPPQPVITTVVENYNQDDQWRYPSWALRILPYFSQPSYTPQTHI